MNRLFLVPVTRFSRWLAMVLARPHNGRINSYVVYVLVTLAVYVLVAWLTG